MTDAVEVNFIDIDIVSEIKPIVEEIGEFTVDEIKKNAPVMTGDYKANWKYKVEKGGLSVIIYNKDEYQLAHLLEYGHVSHDNSYTKPYPHIDPAYKKAVKKFESELRKIKLLIGKTKERETKKNGE